jgi:hypothetical protein
MTKETDEIDKQGLTDRACFNDKVGPCKELPK